MKAFAFEAIGTHWQIDLSEELSPERGEALLAQIHERISTFDRDYSRFRADSLIAQMSKRSGTYQLPADAEPMLDLYRDLYQATNGALTPLIGQVLVEAGYDAEYSLQSSVLHTPPAWEEVLEYKFPELVLKKPALLDVGAAGKGYLIDVVAEIIENFGIHSFCVDAGGDMLQRAEKAETLRVGLEHPGNFDQVIGVATITNQSLCGSAGNRRAWGTFHHIINPHTLQSPRDILAVWTIAKTTLLADAIATCLFLVPAKSLLPKYQFEYALVRSDYSIERSPGFPGEFFVA